MRVLAMTLAWTLRGVPMPGQVAGANAAQTGTEAPVATLRVFVDLVQVPVLVLNDHLEPLRDVDPSRFTVSVDSGPEKHPRHVRVEGDDPVALGIFLDVNARRSVMGKTGVALANLGSVALRAPDHVTVFAMDCHLFRSMSYARAQPALLEEGVDRALAAGEKALKIKQGCREQVYLWDAVYRVLLELAAQQGRRVLIVVSNGEDRGSKHTWNEVRLLAQSAGVAIFGLTAYTGEPLDVFGNQRPGLGGEDPFRVLSETSGGILLPTDRDDLSKQMARIMAMVRQRYVVEFSRPRDNAPGMHDLLVKVAKGHPLVRPSGVSMSIPDPAVEKDSMTIPRDTTDAPEFGKRTILKPKPN